jgi:hypothetical protein
MKKNFQQFDWEGIYFPLTVSGIICQLKHYNIPYDAELTIWRDDDYRLKGILKGILADKDDLKYRENGNIKKIGFVKGESILASNGKNNYSIEGFGLESEKIFPVNDETEIRFGFTCNVYLDNICQVSTKGQNADIRIEWYLCSMPQVFFSRQTYRYNELSRYKVRDGIDSPIENKNELFTTGHSFAWDYLLIQYQDYKIIVQEVNESYLPQWSNGIAIEYRSFDSKFPSEEFQKVFREYLSFMLGSHLQHIGTSEYTSDNELVTCKSQNPWKRDLRRKANYHPVPLRNGYDREFLEKMLNDLLPNFIILHEQTALSECLWRLWIGLDLPIGTNLPIVASGFELLVNSYLSNKKILKIYTKSDKFIYNELIKEELISLKTKLASYEFVEFVTNKIENPYNYGIGEKMKIFFKDLSIEFDKNSMESKALKARNLMTHQGAIYETYEEQTKIKKISDAYTSLIYRVILKLLEHNGYYIDYSKEGERYLKVSENL